MDINEQWQKGFVHDLTRNLRVISTQLSRELNLDDIIKEGIMYSCDMCLEFYRRGPFKGITPYIIDNITYNVCVAICSIVEGLSTEKMVFNILPTVKEYMSRSETFEILQQVINEYYDYYSIKN